MIKKFALVAAALVAMAGLTAAVPASAAPPTPGTLTMHSETEFQGEFAVLSEGAISTACTATPLASAPGVLKPRAATLEVSGQLTITAVEFHTTSACNDAQPVRLLAGDPSAVRANIPATNTFYKGIT